MYDDALAIYCGLVCHPTIMMPKRQHDITSSKYIAVLNPPPTTTERCFSPKANQVAYELQIRPVKPKIENTSIYYPARIIKPRQCERPISLTLHKAHMHPNLRTLVHRLSHTEFRTPIPSYWESHCSCIALRFLRSLCSSTAEQHLSGVTTVSQCQHLSVRVTATGWDILG